MFLPFPKRPAGQVWMSSRDPSLGAPTRSRYSCQKEWIRTGSRAPDLVLK